MSVDRISLTGSVAHRTVLLVDGGFTASMQ